MPITPFHLGPGAVFKAIGGRHFSFMVFGGSQVLMDLEPLYGVMMGWLELHGYSHTLAGAVATGTMAGLIGKPISEAVLDWLKVPRYPLSWRASFTAAYLGTFSHLVLDGIMHGDMRPWWPLSDRNGLLSFLTIPELHMYCALSGVVGGAVVGWCFWRKGRA